MLTTFIHMLLRPHYEVTVVWGSSLYTHRAYGLLDAIDWADCYPSEARVRVWRRLWLMRLPGSIVLHGVRP